MADQLEDDFYISDGLVSNGEEEDGVIEPIASVPRDDVHSSRVQQIESVQQSETQEKQVKSKKRKEKSDDSVQLTKRQRVMEIPSTQSEQFSYFMSMYTKYNNFSQLEKDQKPLDQAMFVDTSSHVRGQILECIQTLVPNYTKTLSHKAVKQKARPRIVIVCASAIRSVNLIRSLSSLHALCKIGKLFAKHMKITEQIDFLKRNKVQIVVGTPARLEKIDSAIGLFENTEFLIVDCEKDKKERTLFTVPECNVDFYQLVHERLLDRLSAGTLKIAMV